MTLVGRVYNYLEIGHRKQVKVVCLPLTRSIAARTMVVSISHRSYSTTDNFKCDNVCYHSRRPVSTSAAKLQVEGYEKRNKKLGRPLSPSLSILATK